MGEYSGSRNKIKVKCAKCSNIWYTLPSSLLNGCGCPRCNESKGERSLTNILEKYKINYVSQYKIPECRNKYPLPFDFAIFDTNNNLAFLVEYDGVLHYKSIDWFGGDEHLEGTQYRDSIKTNYCKDNDISLLRIPYWEFDNIESILTKELNRYGLIKM